MCDSIEKECFGSFLEDNIQFYGDLILNVDCHNEDFIRFDVLSSTSHGEPTYASKTYYLKTENGFSGLFDFFDDFFQKRIRFFNSSRSVQKFLIALNNAEEKFMIRTGHSFFDYYNNISQHALNTIHLHDSFANPMTECLSTGYGIENESRKSYVAKTDVISQIDHGEKIVLDLIESLKNQNNNKCIGNFICIDSTDENEKTFFMESSIHMPILFYYYEFAIMYIHNLVIPYAKHKVFGNGRKLKVCIYELDNDATLSDLLSICDNDGKLLANICHDNGILNDGVVEIEYSDDYIEGKMLSSIIAH